MITDLVKNFITGGLLSAVITGFATVNNQNLLNLSAFVYAAPTVFFYLINIVWLKTDVTSTLIFAEHIIYGAVISLLIAIFNFIYLIPKFSRKTVFALNIFMLVLILWIYQIIFMSVPKS